LKAVQEQGLSYTDLKRLSRASLEHSFLAGRSVWQSKKSSVAACELDLAEPQRVSATCKTILDRSEKARVQWQLEHSFAEFEKKF
jgi:hypothetical protein